MKEKESWLQKQSRVTVPDKSDKYISIYIFIYMYTYVSNGQGSTPEWSAAAMATRDLGLRTSRAPILELLPLGAPLRLGERDDVPNAPFIGY